MKFRQDKKSTNPLSALGLGCMRLPRDKSETERIILTAIEGGVNFFDTAYLYPGSEAALGEVLAKHNKREAVYIATKLPAVMCKKTTDFDKFFTEQLRRLQTDYIDYYFMHNLPDYASWEHLRKLGIESWLDEKKKSGAIRQAGFSFHGTYDEFMKILDSYPWEFTMLQYNYYDENYQAGKRGLLAAAERGIPVIVMEPLLGGRLATGLSHRPVELFKRANPALTPADWALWWLWNQPEVTVVLSGMSSSEIMRKNLQSADTFRELTADELSVFRDVVEEFRKSYKINCTSCNYCLPCPKGINIPACLSVYNTSYAQGYFEGLKHYVISTGAVTSKSPTSPRTCNGCGKCEKACPQNIPIRAELKKVAKRFEPLPLRAGLAIVRRVLS